MHIDNCGTDRLARQIVGNINQSRDRPFAVAAGIVNQKGFNHVLGANSRDKRMRNLACFIIGQRINPNIVRRVGAVMIVEEPRAVARERRFGAAHLVHTFRQRQGSRLAGRDVVQIDVSVAVDIGSPCDRLAVG